MRRVMGTKHQDSLLKDYVSMQKSQLSKMYNPILNIMIACNNFVRPDVVRFFQLDQCES